MLATEFCGTSVTSGSRPQARTLDYLAHNPHIRYRRSDRRGFMLMELTPTATVTRFLGRDDVRDAGSAIAQPAAFRVADGRAGVEQT